MIVAMNWDFLIKDKKSLCVSTDTRNLPAGCVFFALHGEHFDGNKFAKQALEQGATLAVIDNPEYALPEGTLLVKDTLRALQDLALRGSPLDRQCFSRSPWTLR